MKVVYDLLLKMVDVDHTPLAQLYMTQIRQLKEMGLNLGSDEEIAQLLYANYGDINKILNMMGYR